MKQFGGRRQLLVVTSATSMPPFLHLWTR